MQSRPNVRYETRHPHTGEWCELSNKEYRCIKLGLPTTSTLWQLLSAEKEYIKLLTIVTERSFDKPTEAMLYNMINAWPVDVTCSPDVLLSWYHYTTDYMDIDKIVENAIKAAELKAQLDKLLAQRTKHTTKLVKSLQRDIKRLQKIKIAQAKLKHRRAKLRGRR